MVQQRNLSGIVVILLALAVILGSVALYYYSEYNSALASSNNYEAELNTKTQSYVNLTSGFNSLVARYNALSGSYNGSLSSFTQLESIYNSSVSQFNLLTSAFQKLSDQFNYTLSLLASAVSQLNTSEPAYMDASRAMSNLWSQYNNATRQYRQITALFQATFSSFQTLAANFESANNFTVHQLFTKPIEPVSPLFLTANFLLDFGNGTSRWLNGTEIQAGWNMYVATLIISNGNLNATWYPSYGEHLVNGIFGLENTATASWFLWSYDQNSSAWSLENYGADEVTVFNGTSFAWTYCEYNSTTFAPSCMP